MVRRVVREIPSISVFNRVDNSMPKTVVAAYARVSTEREEQEDSFERQVEYYTTFINSKSEWEFGGIYADPGITGTRAEKRPDFLRMISDCRAGKINRILVKSISRFARNTVDALNYIRELRELGVSVYFESESIDTLTPGGEVLITILAAMAEQESRTMSSNIKWAYQKKFKNGEVNLNTGLLLGYSKVKDGEYTINEEEAEIVRRIYREYIAGITVTRICKGLEEDGIPTKLGKTKWSNTVILSILQNEKYTGNAILGKTFKPDVLSKYRQKNTGQAPKYYAENTHPAIIDAETFEMARKEMLRRREDKDSAVGSSRYTSKYAFSGLLVCGICGHRLRRHVRTVGSGAKVPAWGCSNRIKNGRAACDSRHISEEQLQRTYLAAIRDMIDGAEEIMDTVRDNAGLIMEPENKKTLDEIERQIIEVQEAVLKLHRDKRRHGVSDTEYNTRIQEYSGRMGELEKQREKLGNAADRYSKVKAWLDAFEGSIQSSDILDVGNGMVIKALVDRVIIWKGRIEIRFKCGVGVKKGVE